MDKLFRIEILESTPSPQLLIYLAMHQDYSEKYVADEPFPDEDVCGELVVKRLLAGGRGHYGPLEHPSITLATGFFPHSVMQQLRTHRVGVSFDTQSGRYTGRRIIDAIAEEKSQDEIDAELEKVFYFRPVGKYTDRQGKTYVYSEDVRKKDLKYCEIMCRLYRGKIVDGFSEEHARGMIPFDFRQHFVLSCNVRSLMHLLDLRSKQDAQLEIQWFSDLLFERFAEWSPAIANWYKVNRLHKAKLAP